MSRRAPGKGEPQCPELMTQTELLGAETVRGGSPSCTRLLINICFPGTVLKLSAPEQAQLKVVTSRPDEAERASGAAPRFPERVDEIVQYSTGVEGPPGSMESTIRDHGPEASSNPGSFRTYKSGITAG